jgi:hypothetical protein
MRKSNEPRRYSPPLHPAIVREGPSGAVTEKPRHVVGAGSSEAQPEVASCRAPEHQPLTRS